MTKNEAIAALNHMGKAWFVLRYVNEHTNSEEKRWTLVPTANAVRNSYYELTREYHAWFLVKILRDEGNRMTSNKMGITAQEVKDLAEASVMDLLK